MLIDCHTHLNRYTPDQPAALADRLALLRGQMVEYGVDHSLVISSYKVVPERPSVAELLDALDDDPRIGVVAGVSFNHYSARDVAELRDLLRAGRLRGLKLYPGYESFALGDPRMRVIYEMAAESDVPVMIHTGDTFDPWAKVRYAHPLAVDDVAVDFREVTFVICHLGNPWFVDAAEVIYKNENVVGDLSGLTVGTFEPRFARWARDRINELVAFVNDPAKLMFGTDWPISDVGSYLGFVGTLEMTPEEQQGLRWRNAARVFHLPVGGDDDGV